MASEGLTVMQDPPVWKEKVSKQDFQIFLAKWAAGDFQGQRFGQAFVNYMGLPNSEAETRLFFARDAARARQIIRDEFLQGEDEDNG